MVKILIRTTLLTGICFAAACSKTQGPSPEPESKVYNWEKHQPFDAEHEINFLKESDLYKKDPSNLGPLKLSESSGLASSIVNPGYLWTHEDSGNGNMISLVDAKTAEIVCTYRVSGSSNTDWEDIESIKDPKTGIAYLYISDTGDNKERRSTSVIYKIEEPKFDLKDKGQVLSTEASKTKIITFKYQDGSRDVESMFVDKDTEDIYLITKRDSKSRIYILPFSEDGSKPNVAYHVGNLSFKDASAATTNSTTDKFIIRNRQTLFYWERNPDEKLWETFKRAPQTLPFIGEVQGEAVCFDLDDNYYTSSEKAGYLVYPPLYKYSKK